MRAYQRLPELKIYQLVLIGLVAFLIITLTTTTVAGKSTPGDLLYPIDLLTEKITYYLTINPNSKLVLKAAHLAERRDEIIQLANNNKLSDQVKAQIEEIVTHDFEMINEIVIPETNPSPEQYSLLQQVLGIRYHIIELLSTPETSPDLSVNPSPNPTSNEIKDDIQSKKRSDLAKFIPTVAPIFMTSDAATPTTSTVEATPTVSRSVTSTPPQTNNQSTAPTPTPSIPTPSPTVNPTSPTPTVIVPNPTVTPVSPTPIPTQQPTNTPVPTQQPSPTPTPSAPTPTPYRDRATVKVYVLDQFGEIAPPTQVTLADQSGNTVVGVTSYSGYFINYEWLNCEPITVTVRNQTKIVTKTYGNWYCRALMYVTFDIEYPIPGSEWIQYQVYGRSVSYWMDPNLLRTSGWLFRFYENGVDLLGYETYVSIVNSGSYLGAFTPGYHTVTVTGRRPYDSSGATYSGSFSFVIN